MLTNFSKLIMFLTSYVPLYVIFLINFLFEVDFNLQGLDILKKVVLIIIVLLLIIPLAILILIFKIKKKATTPITINKISNSNAEVLNYVLAYIIPFITTNILKLNDLITFLIFFFIIGFIYVKNSFIHVNPTLYFIGYNIYSINENQTLISKKSYTELYTEDNPIQVSVLGTNIYMDFQKTNKTRC